MKILSLKEIRWFEIYILIVFVYFLSHGLMLFIYGAWWDDLLLWNVSLESLDEFMGPNNFNNPFMYAILKSLNQIEDIATRNYIYRIIPFSCWLISISCFFLILKRLSNDKTLTLYASLIAASCGINKTMMLICCYHYSISISLFMIGLVLFTYDYFKSNKAYIVLVSIFWTMSLLLWRTCVLIIPAILVVSILGKIEINLKKRQFYFQAIKNLVVHYYLIIVGLFIFSVLYKTVLAPQGTYASYYSIGKTHLLLSPITTIFSCVSLFLGYIGNLLSVFANGEFKIILVILAFVTLISLLLFNVHDKFNNPNNRLWSISLMFLFFAMMPHLLRTIALSFDLNGYSSRVSALTMFPVAMICALIIANIKTKLRIIIWSFIVGLSICYSFTTYLNYERGWIKNEAITSFFAKHSELQGKKINCIDNTQFYSTFYNEGYRYYEFEGCAKLAYGHNDNTKCNGLIRKKSDLRFDVPDYYVTIDINEVYYNIGLKAIVYRYFNKKKYEDIKNNILEFRIESRNEYENKYIHQI